MAPQAAREEALALKEILFQGPTAQYLEQRAKALSFAQQSGDEALYAELLLLGTVILYQSQRIEEAQEAIAKARAIFVRLQDAPGLAVCLMYSGLNHFVQGDMVAHIVRLREALPELVHHTDPRHWVRGLDILGFTLLAVGLLDAAQEIFMQQLEAARSCRPSWERYCRRAVLGNLEVKFQKLRRRFGWYALPAEHLEVQTLLREAAEAQTMFDPVHFSLRV